MAHQILLDKKKYAVDIIVGGIQIKEYDLRRHEEKKERNKDDIKQIIKDLRIASKENGLHGEIIVYEVNKIYGFVRETHKEGENEMLYLALRQIPKYEKIDKYKF